MVRVACERGGGCGVNFRTLVDVVEAGVNVASRLQELRSRSRHAAVEMPCG